MNPADAHQIAGQNGTIEGGQNVDRIRDILFGTQMRDYDGRFKHVEERLTREAQELRSDVQKRLEALEAFMKGEGESMSNRIKSEQWERSQALDKVARELAETAKRLDEKLSGLDEQRGNEIRDLRHQLLEQSKTLSNEIKEKHDQLKAGLEQEAGQIRGAMTGREALAEMLSEVSLRLKGDFRVPGAN